MYRKAVVPLDGSELAECVFPHIKDLVKCGALGEVVLINVVGVEVPWEEMERGIDYQALRQKFLEVSQEYLDSVQTRLAREGIEVKTESVEAVRPSHGILEYARQKDADIIVMATHGRTGMQRLLLGSVAFKVLHESPIPVLLVRPESCAGYQG